MLGVARDLAIDLAPFSQGIVVEALNKLAAGGTTPYTNAADAVALALAPYSPTEVVRYVSKGTAQSWSQPIGIAVARHDEDFYKQFIKRTQEPVLSWLYFVHDPSAQTEHYAMRALNDLYFKNFAYWVAAAALKDQTKSQK